MGGLKTIFVASLMFTVGAPAQTSEPIHFVFAACVGRFSAEMEHAWLLGDPEAEIHQSHRRSFIALMDASMPAQGGRATLAYRIDHKMAHASLLTAASFDQDSRRAAQAKIIAKSYRQRCERLLLDS